MKAGAERLVIAACRWAGGIRTMLPFLGQLLNCSVQDGHGS